MSMTLTLRCNDQDAKKIEKLKKQFNHTQASKVIKRCIEEFFSLQRKYDTLYKTHLDTQEENQQLKKRMLKLETAYMRKKEADQLFADLLSGN